MDNYERAKKLLQDRVDVLHSLTKALLEKETLDGPEIDAIVNHGQPSAA